MLTHTEFSWAYNNISGLVFVVVHRVVVKLDSVQKMAEKLYEVTFLSLLFLYTVDSIIVRVYSFILCTYSNYMYTANQSK